MFANIPLRSRVDPSNLVPQIKKAYHKTSLRCHPDKVRGLGEAGREAADEHYKKINKAYAVLSNPQKVCLTLYIRACILCLHACVRACIRTVCRLWLILIYVCKRIAHGV